MRTLLSFAFVAALAIASPLAAVAQDNPDQQTTPTGAPKTMTPPAGPPKTIAISPAASQPALAVPPPAAAPVKTTNIQVEVTITDQLGMTAPTRKTVSVITTDGWTGRIRTNANARPSERTGTVNVILNVDARPMLVAKSDDQVLLELTIEYQPLKTVQEGSAETSQTSPTALNQSLRVTMTSGKSMIVSQAADPVTDRKIVVEAKATILK